MNSGHRHLSLIAMTAAAACGGGSTAQLDTFTDSASYAVGMSMAASVQRAEAEISLPALIEGLTDALGDGPTVFTDPEAGQLVQRLAQAAQATQQARRGEDAERNQREGAAFLEENGRRPEVTTTESGLQYEVVTHGDGPRPTPSDRVRVHYRGTLIDGTQFDATDPDGAARTFRVGGLIPGWTEALQLMPVGSTYKLYIPGAIAYGMQGSPPDIGPNATLIFEVTLVGIE